MPILIDPARLPAWLPGLLVLGATVWFLLTALAGAFRAIPEERYVALDRSWPWFAHLARACRKGGTDVLPFFRELIAFVIKAIVDRRVPPPVAVLLVALTCGSFLGANCDGPLLGPVTDCVVGSYSCVDNRPHVCTSTHRIVPAMEACAAPRVCTEGARGVLNPSVATCIDPASAPQTSSGGVQ